MDRSCERGSASQRFGLVGLASLRKKVLTPAGCFSASRHKAHWRASKVSGRVTSHAQLTMSPRRHSANNAAISRRCINSIIDPESARGSLYWELLSDTAPVETAGKRWTILLVSAVALFFLYFFGLT